MHINATEKKIAASAGLTICDLEAFAAISDLHELVADEVINAAYMITRIENGFRTRISAVRRNLDRADAALTAGQAINEHGVLQSTATEIDMLAARRADAYTRLSSACRIANALPTSATATTTGT